jgi:hypothetical protein
MIGVFLWGSDTKRAQSSKYCEACGIPLNAFGNWHAMFKAEPQPPARRSSTEPKCWRASVLLMQDFEASDGVVSAKGEGATLVRRCLWIQIAWAIHGREFAAAQEDHVWGQPSVLVDPAAHLERIYGIQRLCCLGIGYFATVGAGIPGSVKSEHGAGGHAYFVMRYCAENDGAGRGTKPVDDYHLARVAYIPISIDVGFNPAATILLNPNLRVAYSNSSEQENGREQRC